jgi:hypothetical protein
MELAGIQSTERYEFSNLASDFMESQPWFTQDLGNAIPLNGILIY